MTLKELQKAINKTLAKHGDVSVVVGRLYGETVFLESGQLEYIGVEDDPTKLKFPVFVLKGYKEK